MLNNEDVEQITTSTKLVGDLNLSKAHWVNKDTIVWRVSTTDKKGHLLKFILHGSYVAGMESRQDGIYGDDQKYELKTLDRGEQFEILSRYPHLFGCVLLRLPSSAMNRIDILVKSQLIVSCVSPDDELKVIDATSVQLTGVLDDEFYYDGDLGFHMDKSSDIGRISVWSPSAQKMELLHFEMAQGGTPEIFNMKFKNGIWTLKLPLSSCLWTFYKFRVTVYSPYTQKIEMYDVTDPYSRGLSGNGERSQFVDLDDKRTMPYNWKSHVTPELASFSDISVYELHVRDFSANDPTVPDNLKGKYLAFSPSNIREVNDGRLSLGLSHLQSLNEAGITHIHLLPVYDFGSVPERECEQKKIEVDLSQFLSDSEEQQKYIEEIANDDAFNWGYDPVHYGVPDGSYAMDPDNESRLKEFRELVQGLHEMGFRVVCDVVYNHMFHGRDQKFAILDKLVPGYYHRREEDGTICSSACGANCAPEHLMFEKLMIDDLIHWAIDYKIDAFRFDIMGHIMLDSFHKIRNILNNLTIKKHGIDGSKIYLYGEGWDFGEVRNNQRGRNAQQLNLGGTGIGTFNDRFRDSVLGGSPLAPPKFQGLITGLALEPNDAFEQGNPKEQMQALLHYSDMFRVALAGNLKEYEILTKDGEWLKGYKVKFNSNPGGYCELPFENVVFCGCHDNETLFDHTILKGLFGLDIEHRTRMCEMALAMVLMSQGVAFIHAGDELLRSKSLDRDSYNSGDWFNKLDWTGESNNYGVGLPPASKNKSFWPFYRLLLSDEKLKPSRQLIARCYRHVLDFLRIRYSSKLFRISNPEFIKKQLIYYNVGQNQIPGVIVMEINSSYSKGDEGIYDAQWKRIVVVFNARPDEAVVKCPTVGLTLHPVLSQSMDQLYRTVRTINDEIHMPPRLSVVFVESRPN